MSMTTTVLKAEQYSVVNIKWKWDTDGDEELFDSLPEEIVLPLQFASAAEGEDYLDDISEWISDKYGYLHNGFSVRKEHIAYVVFSEMQKQWINELLQMNDAEVYQKYDLERKKALSFTISFDDNMKAQMRFDSDFSEIILFDKDLEVCRGKCQKGTWKANYNDVVYVVEDNNMTAKKAKNIMDIAVFEKATSVMYPWKMQPKDIEKYTETTGVAKNAKIIQFSAIRYKINADFSLEQIDFFDTYINPDEKLKAKITEITGISQDMIEKCPKEDIIAKDIVAYLSKASIYAAHNAPFDIDKINAMFERIGIEFCLPAPKVIDTLPCARDCFPDLDSYKLQDIVENIDTENQFRYHNSLEDIKATALVLEQEVKKYQQLLENIYAQPFKRTAHLNWASCNINTRAKSQQRIKLNIDEDLYGNIFWDIPKKRWDCKRDKKSTQLFAEINMTNLEEQVLHRYGHRYNASNMDELGANWLREKKEKEKNKKSA